MKPLRVGIVGAGAMGRLHARTIARVQAQGDASRLLLVADHHHGRAEQVAHAHTAEASEDWRAALPKIDVLVVAVSTADHFEIAQAALEAGLDVLVEKPLAATSAQAQRLADRARGEGRILQVGHVEWYNPAWRRAAEAAGTPVRIDVERLNPPSDRGLDIDVIQDFMLHDLDWVTRHVGEEVVEWRAAGRRVKNAGLDEADVQLVFRSGCRARIRASRVHAERRRSVRIEGSEGAFAANLLLASGPAPEAPPRPVAFEVAEAATPCGPPDPLERQWRAFLHSVRTRETPANDAEVGLAALHWVERIQQRIAAGASGPEI